MLLSKETIIMDPTIQRLMGQRDKWYGDAVEYWKVVLEISFIHQQNYTVYTRKRFTL